MSPISNPLEELRKEVIAQKTARIEPEETKSPLYEVYLEIVKLEEEISIAVIQAIQGNYEYQIPQKFDDHHFHMIIQEDPSSSIPSRKQKQYANHIDRLNHLRELLELIKSQKGEG